jgi:xylulokinase
LDHYGIDSALLADTVPTFGDQGTLSGSAAAALGLKAGIPVSYRAGDQPNIAYSLNVLIPGELAATAGTSGVVYGVTDQAQTDSLSRVNTFVHVNSAPMQVRNGVLLCLNGTGIAYSWLKKIAAVYAYEQMNAISAEIPAGAEGLFFYPFGNGAERVLENRNIGAGMRGLDFNRHEAGHMARAVQEGIVFGLFYGMEIMKESGITCNVIRAGKANMFLSAVFREIFSNVSGAEIELYDTDGAQGAARAAGVGSGFYRNYAESFSGLHNLLRVHPEASKQARYGELYRQWKQHLLA